MDFLSTLKAAGIELVCDVRDRPQSRRAGFSKRQLAASLDEASIRYVHLKALGTPKEGRTAHREGHLDLFWEIYERQLATSEAKESLAELIDLIRRQPTCLVCYEANWQHCHRARIVERLMAVEHLNSRHLVVEPLFQ